MWIAKLRLSCIFNTKSLCFQHPSAIASVLNAWMYTRYLLNMTADTLKMRNGNWGWKSSGNHLDITATTWKRKCSVFLLGNSYSETWKEKGKHIWNCFTLVLFCLTMFSLLDTLILLLYTNRTFCKVKWVSSIQSHFRMRIFKYTLIPVYFVWGIRWRLYSN